MKWTSANPTAISDEQRLVYYLIITAKGKRALAYQVFRKWGECKAWLRIGNYKQSLAVQHKGVNFSVYDTMPFEKNETLAAIFDDILAKEDLV